LGWQAKSDNFKKEDLVAICKKMDLPVTGNKDDLMKRIKKEAKRCM
jgi:hypothetical protein